MKGYSRILARRWSQKKVIDPKNHVLMGKDNRINTKDINGYNRITYWDNTKDI